MLCDACTEFRFPTVSSKAIFTSTSKSASTSATVTYQTRSKQYEDTNATVSSEALSKSEEGVTGGQRSKSQNRNIPVRLNHWLMRQRRTLLV